MKRRVRRPEEPARRRRNPVVLLCLGLLLGAPGLATAQSVYDPVIRVNDKFISGHDLEQRELLLRALGAPGDLAQEARERLIDERLQVQAAESLGLEVTEDGTRAGLEEFAGRTNSTVEEFLAVLSRNGVEQETFMDFVEAGLLWREVIRSQFVPRAQVTEADVDRAAELTESEGGARVLLSEIILPARNPDETARSEEIAAQVGEINGFETFAAAARQVSVAPSRNQGGRMEWVPLSRLPGPLRSEILTLPPGGISSPVRIPNAIALFQLRALEDAPLAQPPVVSLEYAEFRIPGGTAAEARRVAGRIDTCDDLYGEAYGMPEDRLFRDVRQVSEIPRDVAAVLATLDDNETSVAVRRGDVQLLLMLCGRVTEARAEADRGAIRRQLLNQRVESYASGFLAELRADAVIVDLR